MRGRGPETEAVIEVEYGGQVLRSTSNSFSSGVELFTMDQSGSGQAVAVNQDGSLNSEQNPAAARSIVVFYGTGIGVTSPAGVTGGVGIDIRINGALPGDLATIAVR